MDERQESEAERAASRGDVDALRQAVACGDVGAASESAVEALQAAATAGQWDAVRYLVEEVGMDLGSEETGGVLLQYAAWRGQLEAVRLAVAHGAEVKSKAGANALLSAAVLGTPELLGYLLAAGVDVAACGGRAAWPAAKADRWEAVRSLVEAGADLATGGLGVQLWALAAARGQLDAAALLEARGAEARSAAGALALASLASTQEWPECRDALGHLLASGADVGSEAGGAALLTAAQFGDLEMVRLITESGADLASKAAGEAVASAGLLGPPGSAEAVVRYLTERGAVAPPPPVLTMDEDF